MNHKQKLGYTLLGAGIMAIGIIIGQWGTPDIEAQSNGVFDEVVCTGLTVVNHAGKRMIELISAEDTNMIRLLDKAGTPQMALSISGQANSIMISNKKNRGIGIWLISEDDKDNQVLLYDPEDNSNHQHIALRSHDGHSLVVLGHRGKGITLYNSEKLGNLLEINNEGRDAAIVIPDEMGNITWSAP